MFDNQDIEREVFPKQGHLLFFTTNWPSAAISSSTFYWFQNTNFSCESKYPSKERRAGGYLYNGLEVVIIHYLCANTFTKAVYYAPHHIIFAKKCYHLEVVRVHPKNLLHILCRLKTKELVAWLIHHLHRRHTVHPELRKFHMFF